MWLAVFLMFIVLFLMLVVDAKKPKNFPPGPGWVPILGSALTIEKLRRKYGNLCNATTQMSKYYTGGKVVGLRVGNDRQVVITTYDGAKELASKPELDGRPHSLFYRLRTKGYRKGIILVDEDFWRDQRRFLIKHLRDFGWGKSNAMETIVLSEVHAVAEHFRTAISNAASGVALVPLHDSFAVSMLNTIWTMLAGIRYEPNDLELRRLQKILGELFSAVDMTGCLFSQFPFLRYVAPESSGYRLYQELHQNLWSFVQEEIQRHQETYVPGKTRDFMDVFISEMHNRGHEDSSYSELQLMSICLDLFIAGSDTTNRSLGFGFLQMLRNPEVVKRAQQEMDAVINKEAAVTLADRPRLPYVEAITLEAIRFFMGNSMGVPHRALSDCTLQGYHIPKDTSVVVNYYGFLFDEHKWPEPHRFNPERFLDPDNKICVPENFVPFGLGKRRCLGEIMAKTSLFLIIANILHTFDVRNPTGFPYPDPEPVAGILASTKPYMAEISLRQ